MAPHSSTLAWKIPWVEEPGRLQSMGSLRVGHDWANFTHSLTVPLHCTHSLYNSLDYLVPKADDLEKAMATHSSTLAWKIPWVEEPGGLQSMGSLRVRHDWATSLSLFTFLHWRRKWQPTPVFLPVGLMTRWIELQDDLFAISQYDFLFPQFH